MKCELELQYDIIIIDMYDTCYRTFKTQISKTENEVTIHKTKTKIITCDGAAECGMKLRNTGYATSKMCAFSFMNSKRYKPMLNKRREVSGRACYLCVAAYLLTSN